MPGTSWEWWGHDTARLLDLAKILDRRTSSMFVCLLLTLSQTQHTSYFRRSRLNLSPSGNYTMSFQARLRKVWTRSAFPNAKRVSSRAGKSEAESLLAALAWNLTSEFGESFLAENVSSC